MNQYELGKHALDNLIVERIAGILNLPTSYFFFSDISEAKLLVAYHRLSSEDKVRLLSQALEMIGEENGSRGTRILRCEAVSALIVILLVDDTENKKALEFQGLHCVLGGEGGIRTHGTV
ncbi:hypothetical protein [Pandoraea eparura]|uniref:hypothetical protein n=1 Tax=Pandoraea eparura TaxID=2508291 RepID=UPI001C2DBC62|nr:hypothetical protein [Pandoraea eparura]